MPPSTSTPSSIATPAMPIATPARLALEARSSPSSANASRNVKIGAAATRMPVSDDAMWRSPAAISSSGPPIWTTASTRIALRLTRRPPSAPARAATGSSTSAASAVRTQTISVGDMSSSSATLMNR